MSIERKKARTSDEPSKTGQVFLDLCRGYQERNPDSDKIPIKIQDLFWVVAAEEAGDEKLVNDFTAVLKQK